MIGRLVWPTYCEPHVLHVMQYITLLLLHVTLCLDMYSLPVYVHFILPVVSNLGQYLQLFFLLQLFMRFG